jgi:hypothetical protein
MSKLSIFIFSSVLTMMSYVCVAQTQDEAEINQLFSNYMEKYNFYIQTGVLHHKPGLYSQEVMVLSNNRPPQVVTEIELYGQIEVFLDSLKKRGVTKVNWQKVDIHMLGSNMALASNIAIRYNKHGDVIDRVGASYTMYKKDTEWRISAFAIHHSNTAFRFNPTVENQNGKLGRLSTDFSRSSKQ